MLYRELLNERIEANLVSGNFKKTMKLYHGANTKYDTLKPVGFDYGNALQKAGFSLFCFNDKELAIKWAVFKAVLKGRKLYKHGKLEIPHFGYFSSVKDTIITKNEVPLLLEIINGRGGQLPLYIYEFECPMKDIGIGNDSRHHEYTVRKEITDFKSTKLYINKNNYKKYIRIVDEETFNNIKKNSNKSVRGIYNNLYTKDYAYQDKELTDRLQHRVDVDLDTDIDDWMKYNKINYNKITTFDRITHRKDYALYEDIGNLSYINTLLDNYKPENIWLTTDWHIYKSEVTGDNKKQSILELMKLVTQQRLTVKPNDIFIYMGDISYKRLGDEYDNKIREVFSRLNGIKILIRGNHDIKDDDYYLSLGFNYVFNELKYKNILFSHRPVSIKDINDVDINIHGHIHGERVYFDTEKENHLDCWTDNHKPISLAKLLKNKDKIENENIDIYNREDDEKLLNRQSKKINVYKHYLNLFFKRYPKYKNLSKEEMYKQNKQILFDFISMPEIIKDEELIGWRCTKMTRKSAYESLSYKPVSMPKYEHTVCLNKDTEIVIDPCGELINKPMIYTNGDFAFRFNWELCYGFGYPQSGEGLTKEYPFPQKGKRVDTYAKRNNITLNENLILPNRDIKLNVDHWGKTKYENILWITGFSGSGKSTLANQMADKNTILLQLDYFHHFGYSKKPLDIELFIYKKVPEYKEIAEAIHKKEKEEYDYIGPQLDAIFIDVLVAILKYSEKVFGKEKIICEGFQLYNFVPFSFIEGQPLIIKGTSALQSFIRRMKREQGFDEEYDEDSLYENIKKYYKWYKGDDSKLNSLKHHIKLHKNIWMLEEVDIEMMYGDILSDEDYETVIETLNYYIDNNMEEECDNYLTSLNEIGLGTAFAVAKAPDSIANLYYNGKRAQQAIQNGDITPKKVVNTAGQVVKNIATNPGVIKDFAVNAATEIPNAMISSIPPVEPVQIASGVAKGIGNAVAKTASNNILNPNIGNDISNMANNINTINQNQPNNLPYTQHTGSEIMNAPIQQVPSMIADNTRNNLFKSSKQNQAAAKEKRDFANNRNMIDPDTGNFITKPIKKGIQQRLLKQAEKQQNNADFQMNLSGAQNAHDVGDAALRYGKTFTQPVTNLFQRNQPTPITQNESWENIKKEYINENKKDFSYIPKIVNCTMDRPMGYKHPKNGQIYPINYGYVNGIMGGDGEEQDVYVLGVDHPIKHFKGKVIAVIHRINDNEDKWVVCPENMNFSKEEIIKQTYFMERWFKSKIYLI